MPFYTTHISGYRFEFPEGVMQSLQRNREMAPEVSLHLVQMLTANVLDLFQIVKGSLP